MINIGVIGGAGYVGLITGVGLATLGHRVISQDVDVRRLNLLKAGKSTFFEKGLESVLQGNLDQKQITFTDDPYLTIRNSDALFIAVGTPSLENGAADLSAVISVAEQIRDTVDTYTVIIVKSTVPVGTIEVIVDVLSQKLREGEDFDVVSNPEFLREGSGLLDFFMPSRIIVGSNSKIALKVLRDIYQPLIDGKIVADLPG